MDRTQWADLPAATTAAVAEACGALVVREHPASAGINSAIASTLDLDDGRRLFCKGVRLDAAPYLLAMYEREAAALAALPPGIAPGLLWQVRAEGWWLFGIEHRTGRPADLAPRSPDLPALAHVLRGLGNVLTPSPLADQESIADRLGPWQIWARYRDAPPSDLDPWAAAQLDHLADANAAVAHLAGETLLHTDLNPHNWIVGGDGQAAVIDWSWTCTGPAWAEAEWIAPRLIAAGHTPTATAAWVDAIHRDQPDPAAQLALVATIAGIWHYRARQGGFRPDLSAAALSWLRHRWNAAYPSRRHDYAVHGVTL